MPISPEMFRALLHQEQPNEGLWFDQGCIDQENEEERLCLLDWWTSYIRTPGLWLLPWMIWRLTRNRTAVMKDYVRDYEKSRNSNPFEFNSKQSHSHMVAHPGFRQIWKISCRNCLSERGAITRWELGATHIFLVPRARGHGHQTFLSFTASFFLHLLSLAVEMKDFHDVKIQALSLQLIRYNRNTEQYSYDTRLLSQTNAP